MDIAAASRVVINPVETALIRQFHAVFHTICRLECASERRPVLRDASHAYRAALRSCILKLDGDLDRMEAADADAVHSPSFINLQQQSEGFKLAASIWHLTELLFLDENYDLRNGVRSWIQANFQEAVTVESWDDVLLLIIQGQTAEAVAAIEAKRLDVTDPTVSQLAKLLRAYPYTGASKRDHDDFRSRARASIPVSLPEDSPVKLAFRILSGDVSALTSAPLQKFFIWTNVLNVRLMYELNGMPLEARDFRIVLEAAFAACDVDLSLGAFQCMLGLSTGLPFDGVSALFSASPLVIPAHLAHLLYLSGHLYLPHGGDDGRGKEYVFGDWSLNFAHRLLLEHAVRMMDQPDSWQIALTYAAVSPNEALRSELCTTILTHVDPSSDAIALKLYEAATNLQMTQVASSICAVRGQQCAARRQFGLALAWFTRGEHVMGLRSLAITLMSYITAEDAPENALTVLGAALKSHHYSAAVTLAPELQFVFHFHDFLVSLQKADAIVSRTPSSKMTDQLTAVLQDAALAVHDMIMLPREDDAVDYAALKAARKQLSEHWPGVLLAAKDAGILSFCPPLLAVTEVQDMIVEFEDVFQRPPPETGQGVDKTKPPADPLTPDNVSDRIRAALVTALSNAVAHGYFERG